MTRCPVCLFAEHLPVLPDGAPLDVATDTAFVAGVIVGMQLAGFREPAEAFLVAREQFCREHFDLLGGGAETVRQARREAKGRS